MRATFEEQTEKLNALQRSQLQDSLAFMQKKEIFNLTLLSPPRQSAAASQNAPGSAEQQQLQPSDIFQSELMQRHSTSLLSPSSSVLALTGKKNIQSTTTIKHERARSRDKEREKESDRTTAGERWSVWIGCLSLIPFF
jgi:hypothetical protein